MRRPVCDFVVGKIPKTDFLTLRPTSGTYLCNSSLESAGTKVEFIGVLTSLFFNNVTFESPCNVTNVTDKLVILSSELLLNKLILEAQAVMVFVNVTLVTGLSIDPTPIQKQIAKLKINPTPAPCKER